MHRVLAILPEGMSLPEKRFWPFSPRVGLGCYLMKPSERGSQASLTRPARGEWWCAVTDPYRPCWVTPHRQARHGGQGGDIDVKGTGCPGNTEPHLPPDTALCHTWMAEHHCDSALKSALGQSESLAVIRISRQNFFGCDSG